MDPVTASIIISAIGSGIGAAGNAAAAGGNYDTAFMNNQQENARQNQRIALQESAMDPFRQQMYQAQNLGRLGMMQGPTGATTPGVAPTGKYATSGAANIQAQSYAPSPELMQWLRAIQQNVAGGQNRAPSVSGWNGSSVMNLLDPNVIANAGTNQGVDQRRGPTNQQGPPGPEGQGSYF